MSRPMLLGRILVGARGRRAVILDGSVGPSDGYVDLLAAIALRRRPSRWQVPLVLSECQWKVGGLALDRSSTRIGLRAVDGPKVAYCVLSNWDRERFSETWEVDPGRVFFTPYCHTLGDDDLAAPVSRDGGVFAGGNSLRDYSALVEAAGEIDEEVVLATTRVAGPTPANVTAGPVPHDRFFELLRSAKVVVVPLEDRDDRTAGQQTYLNAMALGKPVVVTDSPGVRDYVENGDTGIVVPPRDPRAMATAIRWTLDPANGPAVDAMTAGARRTARERFSPESYARSLLSVADAIA
jgi:glycosyltransferase involved in cell wall biosynthesis